MKLGTHKLERLKVKAFQNAARNGKAERFEFYLNPSSVNSHHENRFGRLRGINTSGRTSTYAYSAPDQMTLQLNLDNTLITSFTSNPSLSSTVGIKKQVDKFLKDCFYMDGDIHQPRFLLVEWGTISFECRLKSAQVSYTHFDANGEPLRAQLDTVFVADMPEDKRIRLENKKSPDITHEVLVLEGQNLPGLSKEIYGDNSQYIAVANANQLDHFRKLTPGGQLQFPPLEK